MELRSLRALVEVVGKGGFSAATKSLAASQPTISKNIRQLEEELGAQLLQRLSKGVKLTPAGEVVYQRAITILRERDLLRADLASLQGLDKGTLKIGLPPLGSSLLFAPLLGQFRQRYPRIEIELLEQGSIRLEKAILDGEIETGVSLLPVSKTFDFLPVCDVPLVALLPRDHRLARNTSLKLRDLSDTPQVLFENGFALQKLIEGEAKKRGFSFRQATRTTQPDLIKSLVAAGLGFAILPSILRDQWKGAQVAEIPLAEKDLRWRPAFIWRKGKALSLPAREWLELALREFGR